MTTITMTTLDVFREVADRAVSDWGFERVFSIGHAIEGTYCGFRLFVVFGTKKGRPGALVVDRYAGPIEASPL